MPKISELIKKATKANLNKAATANVRELEETESGNFIAFVDENLESFDVNIKIQGDDVLETTCDCPQNSGICWHILAVLLQIENYSYRGSAKSMTELPTKTRRRKLSESEIVLQHLNYTDVSQWLTGVFKKNKPLEQQFLLDFTKTQKEYTAEEVEIILKKSIDSVLKNRKKADAKEIKKVIDLLTQALSPIEPFIWAKIQEPISFEIGETFVKTIDDFNSRIIFTSSRLDKFVIQFLHQFALHINNIKNEEVWTKITDKLILPLYDYNSFSRPKFEFLLLREIYETASDLRQQQLALNIEKIIKNYVANEISVAVVFNSFFLDVFIKWDLYANNRGYFKPIHHEISYNIKLLEQLKNIDEQLTIDYCKAIIKSNRRKEYNIPYRELLRSMM